MATKQLDSIPFVTSVYKNHLDVKDPAQPYAVPDGTSMQGAQMSEPMRVLFVAEDVHRDEVPSDERYKRR
jgi:hypothetical protein